MQINRKRMEHQDSRNELKESTHRRLRNRSQTGNEKAGKEQYHTIEAQKGENFKEYNVQGPTNLR